MSNKQRYLEPVDTRQKVDLSDQTIQDIIQKHPLPPGNYSESSDSEDTTVDSDTINSGVENSDMDMAVSKQEIEDLFKKFVKTRTKTIYALDPETFSGNTNENASEWMNKFEDYCEIQKISEDKEKILIFAALLKSGAHCWSKNLTHEKKETWDNVKNSFKESYGDSNKWICNYRIENRKLKPGENCDKYIEDMTNLSLLAGMSSDELSKSLIRGLPADLKWQVVAFNPKMMEDTVERILLAESSYQWKTKEHCNTVEERLATHRTNDMIEKLTQRFAELESSLQGCKRTLSEQNKTEGSKPQKFMSSATNPPCRFCNRTNHPEFRCFLRNRRQRGGSYNRFGSQRQPRRQDNSPYYSSYYQQPSSLQRQQPIPFYPPQSAVQHPGQLYTAHQMVAEPHQKNE